MITTNSAWDVKNALAAKMPIYAFAIGGQATVYTTHDLTAAGITGTLPAFAAWLKTPQGPSQAIDVLNGSSSVGELVCEVVDVGGAVRTLVGGQAIEGQTATLSVGYPGIAWTEFVTLQTYVVYKVNPTVGYTSWEFVCRDRQALEKKTIYYHPENDGLLSEANPWYLAGTPAECLQAVCLFALGLAEGAIDRAGLAALDAGSEGIYAGARPFLFCLTESFEAKGFIESELLKPSGMYPVISNTGKISAKCVRPPAAGASAAYSFTEDNMVILPKIDRMPVINEAVWEFDSDGSGYGQQLTRIDAASVGTYGRGSQWRVQSAGLRSELGAFWFAEFVTERVFNRFNGVTLKGGAPVMEIESFLMTMPVWVGDIVSVTHTKMPNVLTGALGVTNRLYEVIDRQPDYAQGKMRFKLLDTGLTGVPAAATWGAGSGNPMVWGTGVWY